jgi:hypothetical protein
MINIKAIKSDKRQVKRYFDQIDSNTIICSVHEHLSRDVKVIARYTIKLNQCNSLVTVSNDNTVMRFYSMVDVLNFLANIGE